MPYNSLIPAATDQLSISQGDIRTNFVALGAIAGNATPSSGSLNVTVGFNWVHLASQAAAIPPVGSAFAAGVIGIYSATSPITTKNELYVNKTNQATVVQVPITASSLSNVSAPASTSSGWAYLPSGHLIKWGTITGAFPNGTWQNFAYPIAATIPVFNTVFYINVQPVAQDAPPGVTTHTFNYLTVASNYTAADFWWIPRTNFGNVNQQQLFYYAMGY